MSSIAACHDFDLHHAPAPARVASCADKGIFGDIVARVFAGFERSRQRRLEQQAGRFIATHGGRVTDDVERQLGEHFSGGGFPPYRARPFRAFTSP